MTEQFIDYRHLSMISTAVLRKGALKLSRQFFGWPPESIPHEEKARFIAQTAARHRLKVFVETGTFRGEMVALQIQNFEKLVSIELSEELYRLAAARFSMFPQVRLIHGDSGEKLAEVASELNEPALFWLDAHYSFGLTAGRGSNAPIFRELSCLSRRCYDDLILIDDARLFGWDLGYPRLSRVRGFVSKHWLKHSFSVELGIICIRPPATH